MKTLLPISFVLPVLVLAPPVLAQTKRSAKPADTANTAPAVTPTAKPTPGEAASSFIIETPGTAVANPSLETPIGQLIGDPRTKAVLDKDLPGLSDDSNLAKFSDKSLRQFQPLTGGQLTDALLQQVGNDLKALGAAPGAITEPEPASAMDHTVEQKGTAPPSSTNADEDKPR